MNTNSLEAYENMKPKIPTDHELILSVLSDEPLTYKEIGYKVYKKLLLNGETRLKAFAWKHDPNKVSRRTKELLRMEKIKIKETRKCTIAGSKCYAYIKL